MEPVIEPEAGSHADPDAGEALRTDPRSFAVRGVTMLGQLAFPIAIATFTIFDKGDFGRKMMYFLPLVLAVIGANFFFAYLAWKRFTYQVNEADIRVESGIVSRAARSVPYDRVQDVSLEQSLVPRLFGLVQVKFETGAGGKDELTLRYLSEDEGARLRDLVRTRRDGVAEIVPGEAHEEPEADALFEMGPKRVVTFGLFEFSLAVVAVVGGLVQQFDFLLDFELWDIDEWEGRLAGPGAWLAGLGVVGQAVGVIIAAAALMIVGFLTGLARTILREWDFRLERSDKGLRRRRGLLTRTDVVMPIHRVQALRVGTGFLRKFFGWHHLSVVSLAQDSGDANHDAAPFAQMAEIEPIVATTGFRLPGNDAQWQRGARAYRVDKVLLAALILVPLAIVLGVSDFGWLAIMPVLGLAAIAAAEFYNWYFAANALDEEQLYVRRSKLAPKLSISNRVKLQSVEIAQGPLARWRGYATLHCGLAGGKFRIHGIPLARANQLRNAILASIGRKDFSELI